MQALDIKATIAAAIRSKCDTNRAYLGMSKIAACPRELYFSFTEGTPTREELSEAEATRWDQTAWYTWTGEMHEHEIIRSLGDQPAAKQIEIVANFDPRFRGHLDHLTADHEPLDVKSVQWFKYLDIIGSGARYGHVAQMQMYLRHGEYAQGHLVYVARDVPHKQWNGFPIWVYTITPDTALADELDEKARYVLACVDEERPPECACGYCKK
ncbi:MAG: hypothetical protein FOGNACKC_00945 [Anaerolineae bacterium]|nr:hypothetical protein [Anaerolineae bacterium]